jgi:hypothetical protein
VFTQDHNVVFGVRELPAPESGYRQPGLLAAGTPCTASANRKSEQTQLLPVLVDVNDIETSDPPRHPAARRHLRGPGRKALAALVLSGVALVIFGRLTLWTLLVTVSP